jgi:hypothetical protein
MRKALSVSALMLAFICSAHADGIMQNDSPQPPPPQSATAVQTTTTDGNMQNDVADSLTQIALDVLAVLPSLP